VSPTASFQPDDEKAKHAELVKNCAEDLTIAANATDPLAAVTDGLMALAAAKKHLGTKEYRTKRRTSWWNKGLSKLHKRVRKTRKRTLRADITDDRRDKHKKEYKEVLSNQSKHKHACSQAKKRCIESFQRKFGANDINRTWVTTASQRGKRHPKYTRRTAADPEAAAQYWQGIYFLGAAL